ncbi:MAG: dephospho-CoA kinase [Clostridiales bacterium]|nr:dephospho-CoA kinase [Clostridiales bacterium]
MIDLNKPFVIGLTGQSGAGKSYIADKLKRQGFNIVDADYYSKKITENNSCVFPELQREFGKNIVKDGKLQRQLLADRAFASPESTAKLNKIMHPAILKLCIEAAEFPCVLDAPQLFESGATGLCSKTVAVIAPEELRLKRIMKRDGITKEQAKQRINAQHSEEFFKENSDFIIINDGRDTDIQIKTLSEEIV